MLRSRRAAFLPVDRKVRFQILLAEFLFFSSYLGFYEAQEEQKMPSGLTLIKKAINTDFCTSRSPFFLDGPDFSRRI